MAHLRLHSIESNRNPLRSIRLKSYRIENGALSIHYRRNPMLDSIDSAIFIYDKYIGLTERPKIGYNEFSLDIKISIYVYRQSFLYVSTRFRCYPVINSKWKL